MWTAARGLPVDLSLFLSLELDGFQALVITTCDWGYVCRHHSKEGNFVD